MFRFLVFGVRMAQQAVPAGGVYFAGWATASGLALYWADSMLLLLASLVLLWRAPRGGEPKLPPAREVLAFQGGAFLMFAGFFGGFLFIAHQNLGMPFDMGDVMAGLPFVAGCAAVGLAIDLIELRHAGRPLVLARINAGMGRFAVFWMVGFFGSIGVAMTNRMGLFFGIFAGAKILFELGQVLGTGEQPAI
jgi:hypothetical protein